MLTRKALNRFQKLQNKEASKLYLTCLDMNNFLIDENPLEKSIFIDDSENVLSPQL